MHAIEICLAFDTSSAAEKHSHSLLCRIVIFRRLARFVCNGTSMCEEENLDCNGQTSMKGDDNHQQDPGRLCVGSRDDWVAEYLLVT